LLGDHQRHRNAYLLQLETAAQHTVEEHQREVHTAQLAERAHLAREMHDAVAHHVSMIVVQAEAGASRTVARSADKATAAAFDDIADSGRTTLNELRVLLGVLRADEGPAPVAPQPGIDRIDDLVRRVREAGMTVDLHIEGDRRAMPPAVDLSAYRIVQEGLTNVLKHSDAGRAEVTLRFAPHLLELAVRDDGRARERTAPSGHGLRERVALLQGTITAGCRPAGGFELAVSLPVEG
jgi:signal transduction histidine kinase